MFDPFNPQSKVNEIIANPTFQAQPTLSNNSLFTQEPFDQMENDDLHTHLLSYITNNQTSHLSSLLQYLQKQQKQSLLNLPDSEGTPPLCVASCFGHEECVRLLLQQSQIQIDIQDKHGWTPLTWAMSNGHERIIQMLQMAGAQSSLQIKQGLTVDDFISTIQTGKHSRTDSQQKSFYKEGFDFSGLEQELNYSFGAGLGSGIHSIHFKEEEEEEEPESDDEDEKEKEQKITTEEQLDSPKPFNFDACQPDQMFVFDSQQIETILSAILYKLQIPHVTKSSLSSKFATANTLFLCSRYAHYYGSQDLLQELLTPFFSNVKIIVLKSKDMSLLTYWLANMSQILFYFKRDPGLLQSTAQYQVEICEFIQEIYMLIVGEARKRLLKVAVECLIRYQSIPFQLEALEKRSFQLKEKESAAQEDNSGFIGGILNRFRSPGKSPSQMTSLPQTPQTMTPLSIFSGIKKSPTHSPSSPKMLLTHLASMLFLFQSYHVHPIYQRQMLVQLLYALSNEMMNSFLNGKIKVSRALGMNVRMNLSMIEDWVRQRCDQTQQHQHQQQQQQPKSLTLVDGLLKPLFVSDPISELLWPFHPLITICRLLQVMTSALQSDEKMNEQEAAELLKGLYLNVGVITEDEQPSLSRSSSQKDFEQDSVFVMKKEERLIFTWEQLFKIQVDHYWYEKQEPSLSPAIVDLINSQKEKERQLNQSPLKFLHSKTEQKKLSLLKDQTEWLPFRMQSNLISPLTSPDVEMPAESAWGDINDRLAYKKMHEERKKREKKEEKWWKRVKVEVPQWITQSIDQI